MSFYFYKGGCLGCGKGGAGSHWRHAGCMYGGGLIQFNEYAMIRCHKCERSESHVINWFWRCAHHVSDFKKTGSAYDHAASAKGLAIIQGMMKSGEMTRAEFAAFLKFMGEVAGYI